MTQDAERLFAVEVVERLRAAGHQALWAGGCVRDLLLGGQPADYDVATSATPKQVRQLFGHRRTLPVGVSFGVVLVLAPKKAGGDVEVATFRTDSTYSDGRRPDAVTFSTAKEDAQRRDFTINGMFFDPLSEEVIDYVDGQRDLKRGLIRAIGNADERIAEDKLRMLRAVRFAARFGFEIEAETWAAVSRHARQVAVVSGERIAVEIRKTLGTQRAPWALDRWHTSGLLRSILPEVAEHWESIGDVTLKLLRELLGAPWPSQMSGLLCPVVETGTRDIPELIASLKTRLKLSNEESESLRFAVASQSMLSKARQLPWSQVQPGLIHPHIDVALSLLAARNAAAGVRPEDMDWLLSQLALPPETLDPKPLLDGSDLIEIGLRPGPKFRGLLDRVRAMQLDGQLADRGAALRWVRQFVATD